MRTQAILCESQGQQMINNWANVQLNDPSKATGKYVTRSAPYSDLHFWVTNTGSIAMIDVQDHGAGEGLYCWYYEGAWEDLTNFMGKLIHGEDEVKKVWPAISLPLDPHLAVATVEESMKGCFDEVNNAAYAEIRTTRQSLIGDCPTDVLAYLQSPDMVGLLAAMADTLECRSNIVNAWLESFRPTAIETTGVHVNEHGVMGIQIFRMELPDTEAGRAMKTHLERNPNGELTPEFLKLYDNLGTSFYPKFDPDAPSSLGAMNEIQKTILE